MSEKKQRQLYKSPQQIKAVSRLLQLAQRKPYLEDWHEGQRLQISQSLQMKSRKQSKKDDREKVKEQYDSKSLHKKHERQRLQQLVKESVNNEQESLIFEKELPVIPQKRHHKDSLKSKFNEQLRSFQSNLTFYHSQRDAKKNAINSSLTFYDNKLTSQRKNDQNIGSNLRYPQQNQQSNTKLLKQKINSNIVYFKPNKAETIRQLLNHMKISKQRNNHIVLNSTHHEQPFERQQQDLKCFNPHELRQMGKYKNFSPFREDQSILLNKIKEVENIWKRKFKESWQRKKQDLQGKKSYFKRLIVRD